MLCFRAALSSAALKCVCFEEYLVWLVLALNRTRWTRFFFELAFTHGGMSMVRFGPFERAEGLLSMVMQDGAGVIAFIVLLGCCCSIVEFV